MSGAMSAFCQVVLRLSVSREPNPTRTPVLALSSVLLARPLPTPRGASKLGAPESAGHFRRRFAQLIPKTRYPRICGALSPGRLFPSGPPQDPARAVGLPCGSSVPQNLRGCDTPPPLSWGTTTGWATRTSPSQGSSRYPRVHRDVLLALLAAGPLGERVAVRPGPRCLQYHSQRGPRLLLVWQDSARSQPPRLCDGYPAYGSGGLQPAASPDGKSGCESAASGS